MEAWVLTWESRKHFAWGVGSGGSFWQDKWKWCLVCKLIPKKAVFHSALRKQASKIKRCLWPCGFIHERAPHSSLIAFISVSVVLLLNDPKVFGVRIRLSLCLEQILAFEILP